MARRCSCSNRCQHWTSSSVALVPSDRLQRLDDGILKTLIDAADAYDSDALNFDPACGVHGPHPDRSAECSCHGERTTALEFVQALQIDVKAAAVIDLPAGKPGRMRDGAVRTSTIATLSGRRFG